MAVKWTPRLVDRCLHCSSPMKPHASRHCPTCRKALESCPACTRVAVLSARPMPGLYAITFTEPICESCRDGIVLDSQKDAFDRNYDRAIANGWAD